MQTQLAMSIGERVAYAGRMTLIGMLTIFAALSILWGALVLFRMAITAAERRKSAKGAEKPVSEAPAPAAPVTPTTDDGELVAAITAAISLVLAEENGGTAPKFRVVSFRRSGDRSK